MNAKSGKLLPNTIATGQFAVFGLKKHISKKKNTDTVKGEEEREMKTEKPVTDQSIVEYSIEYSRV